MSNTGRNLYTSDDDRLLVIYLGEHSPQLYGRSGNALYKTLVENEQRKWRWAKRHPWQSWRDRYYKNKDWFDPRILQYQKRHGTNLDEPPRKTVSSAQQKRVRDNGSSLEEEVEQAGSEVDRKRKRQKVEEVRRRAKVKRERCEASKEEEEEEEEEDKGEGTSRGALGGRIMRNKPLSTEKQAQEKLQVANEGIGAKLENGSFVDEKRDENSDGGNEEDEEEEAKQEPIGSNDYEGGLFGTSDDEVEEAEVIELTDAQSGSEAEEDEDAEEVDDQLIVSSKSESTPNEKFGIARNGDRSGDHTTMYPAINSVPSPHLHAREPAEPQAPGAYAASSSHPLPDPSASKPLHPQTSASESTLSPKPKPRPPPRHAHPLLQNATLLVDEDFFGSGPSTPTPAPQNGNINNGTTRTRPPKLIEGPFGNSFARTRQNGGGDSDTETDGESKRRETWPPPRRRTGSGMGSGAERQNRKMLDQEMAVRGGKEAVDRGNNIINKGSAEIIDKSKAKEKQKAISTSATLNDSETSSSKPVPTIAPTRRPRPPAQVNAQPSSSRTRLSDLPQRPSSLLPVAAAPALPPQPRRDAAGRAETPSEQRVKDPRLGDGRKDVAPPQVDAGAAEAQKQRKPVNGQPLTSNGQAKPAVPFPSRISQGSLLKKQPSPLRKETSFTMPSESWTPGNPFVDRPQPQPFPRADSLEKVRGKGKARDDLERRHSIGTFSPSEVTSSGRRIDLREEMARSAAAARIRHSLPMRSRTASLRMTPDSGHFGRRSVSYDARRSPLLALPQTDEDLVTVKFLGVSSTLSLIAKNTPFTEEAVMKVWQKMGSIERTEEYFNRIQSRFGAESERIFQEMEEEREKESWRELRGSAPETRGFGRSPEQTDLRLSSSPHRSANSEQHDLHVWPLRQDDDAPMSEYSPPHSSRAGQYARLVKQGRKKEALERERRRASIGGIGQLFPRELSNSKESSPALEVREEEAGEVPRTRSPTVGSEATDGVDAFDLELPEDSQWGDEEEAAFASASADNAHALREIESRMSPEFMRKWTALHLIRLRQKAEADASDPFGNLESQI